MPYWKARIELPGFTEAERSDYPKFAAILANGLKNAVGDRMDDDLRNLIFEFIDLANEETSDSTVEDFDDAMADLYDWGDRDHRLRVANS